MYLLHPTGLLKGSFGSNCGPRQHLIQYQKICFYLLIVLFNPNSMLQSTKKFSLSLGQSFIDQHWMKRKGDCRTVSSFLATIVGSKNKNIHLRDFKDVDFNFTHFANFNFLECALKHFCINTCLCRNLFQPPTILVIIFQNFTVF